MQKQDRKEEAAHEALLSAAIVRDIVDRHIYSDYGDIEQKSLCGYCQKELPIGTKAVLVQSYERKKGLDITLCDKTCSDAHEYAEMQLFGCGNLEDLPVVNGLKKKIRRADLLEAFRDRLLGAKQDYIDNVERFHASYQLKNEDV